MTRTAPKAVTRVVTARSAATAVDVVFREVYGQAVATLVRVFGDITLAEDAVQDAFVVASDRWPSDGIPPSPAAWIITTARNRAIDGHRRSVKRQEIYEQLRADVSNSGGTTVDEWEGMNLSRTISCASSLLAATRRLGRRIRSL